MLNQSETAGRNTLVDPGMHKQKQDKNYNGKDTKENTI